MNLYLHNDIQSYFAPDANAFNQLMQLRGLAFRHLEGRLTQRIALGDKSYFIKQHSGIGWKEIIKNLCQLRLPVLSAKNEWLAIQKLQSLGVDVPGIAAYGKRGLNPAAIQSFILMEEVKPIISLEDLGKLWQKTSPTFKFKQKIIEKVAYIAKTLHGNGINHRDFYICHFLLDLSQGLEQINPDNLTLYLIDLHRAQLRRVTPKRWVIKDLAGLYFSSKEIGLTQRDYYRFMKLYSGKSLRDLMDNESQFWQKVKARGEQLYCDHTNG